MLPTITGEFGIVADPELRFSDKGSAWIKIRGIAKDRVRDNTGNWSDGDPLFIDIIYGGQASQNLYESVVKGDTITVTGKLKQREYEKDGEKRTAMEIRADSIGVSVRWAPARTPNVSPSVSVPEVADALGAEVVDVPF